MSEIFKSKQEIIQLINAKKLVRKAEALSKCNTQEQKNLVNELPTIIEDKEFDKEQFEQNTGDTLPMHTSPSPIPKKYIFGKDLEKILGIGE